jgi:ubiquinol-cytochrome c reductase cytochrome b subunit
MLGAAMLAALAITAVTGVGLAFHYVPTTTLAHDSVRAIEADLPFGVWLRAAHWNGTHATVALALLWLVAMFVERGHRPPRHGVWLAGVGMLLTLFAFGVTGELLPFDERAFAATQVRAEILASAPFVGDVVRRTILGGDAIGGPTLTRFHFLHVAVLPVVALALFFAMRGASRAAHAVDAIEGRPPRSAVPKSLAALVGGALVLGLATQFRAPLGVVAEPGDPGFEARPEWYFLWLNQLLHWAKGPLEVVATFWLPNALVVGVLLLPFVDRPATRRYVVALAVLGALVIGVLTATALSRDVVNPRNLDYPLGALDAQQREGYLQVRRNRCIDCHKVGDVGTTDKDAPDLPETGDQELADLDAVFVDPPEDMPAYDHVPYLQWLAKQPK